MAKGYIVKGETKYKILKAMIEMEILVWDEDEEPEPVENVESQFRIYARFIYNNNEMADVIVTDLSTGETRFIKELIFGQVKALLRETGWI